MSCATTPARSSMTFRLERGERPLHVANPEVFDPSLSSTPPFFAEG